MNIAVDQDIKSLVVAGDLDLINELLREVYKAYSSTVSSIITYDNGDVI